MRRILSFVSALAVTATSFVSSVSAANLYSYADNPDAFPAEQLNKYGVPAEDYVQVGLDAKIKWANAADSTYSNSLTYSTSVGTNEVAARTYMDMSKVAAEWNTVINKVTSRREGLTKDTILENATVKGEFTIVIAAPAGISNALMEGATPKDAYDWSNEVKEFFTEASDPVYNATDNTFTVTMKVKDDVDNKKLGEYFDNPVPLEMYVINTVADTSPSSFTYTISGIFSGHVDIYVFSDTEPISTIYFGDGTYTIAEDGTSRVNTPAIDMVMISKSASHRGGGGGGGTRVVATATPTEKPFVADRSERLIDTIEEGYDSEEKINELGPITGYVVDVTNSDGTTGTYGEDYTISDKYDHVLTPAEVNALLSNPNIILDDYNVNLSTGTTAVTKAIYRSGAQIDYNNHFAYIIGYPEGDVRPQNSISRAEVATIFFRLLTDDSRAEYWNTTNSFSDVSADAWYNNAISTIANAGIVNGYEDGSFRPNAPITRAEFATIASRFAAAYGVISADFSDISGHWAAEAIKKAASVGWVTGYEDGTFRPNNNITRAEAMAIVNRVTFRLVESEGLHANAIKWSDNPESAWYYSIVEEATNSHTYTRNTIGDNETWTEITEHRDWAKLEKETSDKAAVVVGIDNGALDYENNSGSVVVEEK